jgi:Lon protease-like protein
MAHCAQPSREKPGTRSGLRRRSLEIVTERIPLFPLGTVLFPGLMLPLHIFEERYRTLIRDLLDGPEPRRFGIVAIELGHEVGTGAARKLATVGCAAEIHEIAPRSDGRFDVVTVGGSRFDVAELDDSKPYLQADVEFRPDSAGTGAELIADRVRTLFSDYRTLLAGAGAEIAEPIELPGDPVRLSYFIAAASVLERDEKQRLLEAADAAVRLAMEAEFLSRENRLLEALPTVPASQFIEGGVNPN